MGGVKGKGGVAEGRGKQGKGGGTRKTGKGGKPGTAMVAATGRTVAATAPTGGKTSKGRQTGQGGADGACNSADGPQDNIQAVPQQGPRMIQVISVSGNLLHVTEPYTNYLTHRRRQRADFTLEELLEPCAEYLRWPKSHIQLACGEVRVRAHHRIADRTRTLVWQPGRTRRPPGHRDQGADARRLRSRGRLHL